MSNLELAPPLQEDKDRLDNRRKETAVAGVEARDFDAPDETRTPDKTRMDVVRMGGATAARLTFQPVRHDDGTEAEIGPGQAYEIAPGHDAWVVGDESFVGYEFETRAAEEYAKA